MTIAIDRVREGLQRVPTWLAVSCLLALFGIFAGAAAIRDSVAYDETAHLAAGYAALDRADYRLATDHPPLARMWAALPAWIGGVDDPGYGLDAWKNAQTWEYGYALLNGPPSDPVRRDPDALLRPARFMMIAMGMALGLIVFAWARDLWGRGGALVALFLYSLSPTMLAHGHLVTTDLPAAFGYTLTLWCFWRFCRQGAPPWAAATGVALGIALNMKLTTVWLLPTLALLGVAWVAASPDSAERKRRAIRVACALAGIFVIAYACIWAGYRFRYSVTPDGSYVPEWVTWRRDTPGRSYHVLRFVRDHHLVPESLAFGLAYAGESMRHMTYLNGEYFPGGSWFYFPEAVLLKTTPALLVLAGWVIVEGARRTRGRSLTLGFIAIPAVLYCAAAATSGLNIGHRHILPLYPLIFVAVGALPRVVAARPRLELALAALLLAHASSSLAACPRYLSYFNFIAGGSSNAWRYLVDSNLDWGQDLRRLREKMTEHGIDEIHLFYFGTGDPAAYGIKYRKCILAHDMRPDQPSHVPGPGDVFAISVQLRQTMRGRGADEIRTLLKPFDQAGDSIFLYKVPR